MVKKYKVWVQIEGLNEDDDCLGGDDYYEPREVGCVDTLEEAQRLQDMLLDAAICATCCVCGKQNCEHLTRGDAAGTRQFPKVLPFSMQSPVCGYCGGSGTVGQESAHGRIIQVNCPECHQ